MIATKPTARVLLRLCLIGIAGLFVVARAAEAATDVVPAPAPPSAQPMPMPAPQAPTDPMQTKPPPGTPPAQPPSAPAKPQDPAKPTPKDAAPQLHDSEGMPDLNTLFDKLKSAKTEDEAKLISAMIQVELLQSGSDTIDLLMSRALDAVQNQDLSLALDLLDTVIALKPDYAEGWNKRATLYFLKRDYGKSISDLEMVLRLQPRHYLALTGLAQILNELGDTKHAIAALQKVLLIYPLDSTVSKELEELQATTGGHSL